MLRNLTCNLAVALLLTGCATWGDAPRVAHPVAAVGKVVNSLADETAQRLATDSFRNLPVVVRTTAAANNGVEPIIAEFLRTRLLERGIAVEAGCAARCMEVTLQEFAIDAPAVSRLTPGQVLTVASGNVPLLSSLVRSLAEGEREKERAAGRASGLLVTFGAREATRYTAREHVVAIVSSSTGDVALEKK